MAAAPPSLIWQAGETGSGAGQANQMRGVDSSSQNGHVYIADQDNARIDEFSAWGAFVKAWGWDVVAEGPDNDVAVPNDQFEICVPANGDACKAGIPGGGSGQLANPQGIAVDSSGAIYVVDFSNKRVQKFDASGHFLLMFGGDVNKTKVEAGAPEESERNRCPVDPGDVCQVGTSGIGNGEFGVWMVGSFIAIDSTDKVYVGDQERIQRFNSDGIYQGQINLPGKGVQSLAADAAGNLYVAYGLCPGCASEPNVYKLTPAGLPASPESFPVEDPRAVAVDTDGNVFVFDQGAVHLNNAALDRDPILQFPSNGGSEPIGFGKSEFHQSTGLGAGFCPGSAKPGNVFVTNLEPAPFVRTYGTPPIGCEPPLARPPEVKAQFAVSVSLTDAFVQAEITPVFIDDTTYFVEYGAGSCASGGCEQRAPLMNDNELGGGVTNAKLTTAQVFINNLKPDTTYHYRFVAKSSGGGPEYGLRPKGQDVATFGEGEEGTFSTPPLQPEPKICSNRAFRASSAAFLPDCRAYEMVSPLDKNGAGIETGPVSANPLGLAALDKSAANGDSITYSSKQAFGDVEGAPYSSQYLTRRYQDDGWLTHGINAPHIGFPGLDRLFFDTEYKAFTEDLSQGWLIHEGDPLLDPPCSPANSPNLYRRLLQSTEGVFATENYEALHCEPNKTVNSQNAVELQGVSEDGCRAVFRSNSKLTPDAKPSGPYQLYESNCEGALRLVSVRPNGVACGSDSSAGSELVNLPGVSNNNRTMSVQNALSGDAKRLYWECAGTLYLRSDPDPSQEGEPGEGSIEVAKPQGPSPFALQPPRFQSASPSGSRMLFTAYDPGSGGFVLKAFEPEAATTTIGSVFEDSEGRVDLLGASEDARRAYLVSDEVLDSGPNSRGDTAIAGRPNLYFYEDGAGFDFIATFSSGDVKRTPRILSPVHPLRYHRASRVSPDGLHAAFIASGELTDYDNVDLISRQADAEVFLYDVQPGSTGELRCISCNPTDARPAGRNISAEEDKDLQYWAAAWIPGWQNQLYQGRPLSEDGSRLFFNSADSLVNRDNNNSTDVYEWERAESREQCVDELGAELYVSSAGGCLSLISSGQDPNDSEFVDADKDGSDVFIRTGESLLVQDPGLVDIYDARVGGGFPPPSPPDRECEGEACQSPPAPPAFDTPSSNAFEGPGNAEGGKPKPCRKGKHRVIRGGKTHCVPRKNGKRHSRRGRAHGEPGRAAR